MDTVTSPRSLRWPGGRHRIIHKNMSIEDQASEVDKVKRSEHGVIVDPFHLGPDRPISDALELMERYRISGVPITVDGKLVGILTNRDLRFETDMTKKISQVMTSENLVTAAARRGTNLGPGPGNTDEIQIEKLAHCRPGKKPQRAYYHQGY